jgi:hypothetical protein
MAFTVQLQHDECLAWQKRVMDPDYRAIRPQRLSEKLNYEGAEIHKI